MPNTYIYGAPGEGKSYFLVHDFLVHAIQLGAQSGGDVPIVSNLPHVFSAIAERFGDAAVERIHPHEYETSDFSYDRVIAPLKRGEEVEAFGITIHPGDRPYLFLDEAGDFLGPKMVRDDDTLKFFRYHRHGGFTIVMAAQSPSYVDLDVRRTVDQFVKTANNAKKSKSLRSFTLRAMQADDGKPQKSRDDIVRKLKTRDEIFDLYISRTAGGGSGDDSSRVGSFSLLKKPIFLGLVFFVPLFVGANIWYWGLHRDGGSWSVKELDPSVPVGGGPSTPAASSKPRSAKILSGVSAEGAVILHQGQVYLDREIVFDPVSGRCAVLIDGEEVMCGTRLP